MKFNTMVRGTLATAISLAMAFGLTACSRDYTDAYVYSASSQNGTISAFAVDYQSGVLTQIAGSPFASQLSNPTTLVAAPNGKFIYVIGGTQNSQVEEFAVGTDGKLYGQNTYNITGSYPTAAAIDSTGSFLYVTFTYQIGYTPASPGPGGITIFPIKSDNTLGTPTTVNVGNNPVAIAVSAPYCSSTPIIPGNTACATGHQNVFVYVVDQEGSTFSPGALPVVLGFAQNTSTGGLSLLSATAFNSTLKTYQNTQNVRAGVTPSSIAIDPTTRYVYVTDKTSNQVIGYQIASGTSGNLTPLVSSPYTTGSLPVSLTIDPRGKYLYTANYNSSTVSGFSINQADGSLSGSGVGGSFTTGTNPTCITIEPALGIYLYTSNYLSNDVSGAQLNANTGALSAIANTPFNAGPLPSCIVSVPNGPHAQSIVNP